MGGKSAEPSVVVPLDGSAQARRALEPAMRVARALDYPVELVTVVDPVNGRWALDLDDTAAAMPFERTEVAIVGSGWPGEVIADLAAEVPGNLVCMATQDRDHLQRLALGSVSTHLMRSVASPILFVGPGFEPQRNLDRYGELVVCIDVSSQNRTDSAIALATDWAGRLRLRLTLVYVAHDIATERAAASVLASHADRLSTSGTVATATVVRSDKPSSALAEFLRHREDALALTVSQRRGSLTRLLLGSVTSGLLARSPAPVLVA